MRAIAGKKTVLPVWQGPVLKDAQWMRRAHMNYSAETGNRNTSLPGLVPPGRAETPRRLD